MLKNDLPFPTSTKKKKGKKEWESANIDFIAHRVLYSCCLKLPKCGHVLPYNCWLLKDSPKNCLSRSRAIDSSMLGKMEDIL